MKKILLSLIISSLCFTSRAQLWTQDFGTNGLGTQYTSVSVFTNTPNAHYNRTNGVGISNTVAPYAGAHGSFFWAAENQNDNSVGGDGLALKTITFSAINVAGQTNLMFRALVASGNTLAGYDYNDSFYFEYRMDAGPWTKFLQFAAPAMGGNIGLKQDANLDGIGEGAALNPTFAQFSSPIAAIGNSLQIRIITINDGLGEEIAFDYLRLYSLTTPVLGCTNPLASNFNALATTDNGSCLIAGCIDNTALNFNPLANTSNGSCVYTVPDLIINEVHYNPSTYAGFSDNTHEFVEVYNRGSVAVNLAGIRLSGGVDYTFLTGTTINAGAYVVVAVNAATYTGLGFPVFQYVGTLSNSGAQVRLMSPQNVQIDAVEYYPNTPWPVLADGNGASLQLTNPILDNALFSSWCGASPTPGIINSCYTPVAGCMDTQAVNYNPNAQVSNNSCIYEGCTYPIASNYNSAASIDNGTCVFEVAPVYGCTYPNALNFSVDATRDDGSCSFPTPIPGCTNALALNYNPAAQIDDFSCVYQVPVSGCTYAGASNYSVAAQADDGSCLFPNINACLGDLNNDQLVGVSDLILFINVFGSTCN